MARRNPLEKVPDKISNRFKRDLKALETFKAVPFGQQEVSPREFRAKFSTMSESDRKKVLDENGQAEVLRQLKSG